MGSPPLATVINFSSSQEQQGRLVFWASRWDSKRLFWLDLQQRCLSIRPPGKQAASKALIELGGVRGNLALWGVLGGGGKSAHLLLRLLLQLTRMMNVVLSQGRSQ